MSESFKFAGFTLRKTDEQDLSLAAAWSELDPAHKGTPAAFWTQQTVDVMSWLLSDAEGPVFFFRMKAVFGVEGYVQVYIQFDPGSARAMDGRAERGLRYGFHWLETMLVGVGFQAVYFDTKNPKLVYFCRKQLGFHNTGRKNEDGGMILKRTIGEKAA
jgi:hypothetical protein